MAQTRSRRRIADAFVVAAFLAVFLLAPDSVFAGTAMSWGMGLILFPVMFIAGFVSSWIYYRSHDPSCIDPFYTRAWPALIGGLVAWPICLIFRPSVADFAFIMFTFGAGPVLAFHVYRHNNGANRA